MAHVIGKAVWDQGGGIPDVILDLEQMSVEEIKTI